MRVRYLSLTNFRNYSRLELTLPDRPILLHGANAQGKTSLLEAIYLLSAGSSPLTSVDRQLVRWGAFEDPVPYARLWAEVERRERTCEIEIVIEQLGLSNGSERMQKTVRIDRARKRRADLAGKLNVVLFAPQDMDIVAGPPSRRRRYLDDTQSQVDGAYAEAASSYADLLRQRNATLRHLREARGDPGQLAPFEDGLARAGSLVTLRRHSLVRELSTRAGKIQQDLTGGLEWLRLEYVPDVVPGDSRVLSRPPHPGNGARDAVLEGARIDAMVVSFRGALQRRRNEEIARGVTLVGPHRDELRFVGGSPNQGTHAVDVGTYGSRGQQRTAVLALKLAELAWIKACTNEAPVLLLDEVLAELDSSRRDLLLSQVDDVDQALLTATDPAMFSDSFRQRAVMWQVGAGVVKTQ